MASSPIIGRHHFWFSRLENKKVINKLISKKKVAIFCLFDALTILSPLSLTNLGWGDKSCEWGGGGGVINDVQGGGGGGVARPWVGVGGQVGGPRVGGGGWEGERAPTELSALTGRPLHLLLLPSPELVCLSPEIFHLLSSTALRTLPSMELFRYAKRMWLSDMQIILSKISKCWIFIDYLLLSKLPCLLNCRFGWSFFLVCKLILAYHTIRLSFFVHTHMCELFSFFSVSLSFADHKLDRFWSLSWCFSRWYLFPAMYSFEDWVESRAR